MLNSNNILIEIKELLQQLIAKQEALELEQKQHLEVIFKIAREELTTVKHDDKKHEEAIMLAVRDLLKTTKVLPQTIIEQIRGQITHAMVCTMRQAYSDMTRTIEKITCQLQDIIKEITIDPDNPKPIELRTEENSKQILALSKQVIPLVVDIQKLLEKLDPVISKMSKALS